MDKDFYTYAYLRKDGTPYYVGKGTGRRAFVPHRNGLLPVPPDDRILFLKKNITNEDAVKHEIYMIAVLGREDKGEGRLLNLTDGGDGVVGLKRTEEFVESCRKRMTGNQLAKGNKHTEEHKQYMRQILKGRPRTQESIDKFKLYRATQTPPMVGRKHSEETKLKIRASNIGQTRSEETKRKISEAAKRRHAENRRRKSQGG